MLLLFLFSKRVINKEMVIIISIKRSKISAKDKTLLYIDLAVK